MWTSVSPCRRGHALGADGPGVVVSGRQAGSGECEGEASCQSPRVHRYTMSKQSGGVASTGAPVHYEQAVSTRRIHGRTGIL